MCRTSECRNHGNCAPGCQQDHREEHEIELNRSYECHHDDCTGNQQGEPIVSDRDYQAAGAMLAIGRHYEESHGGRYAWNLSAWYNANNPYQPPAWAEEMQLQ